MAIIINTTAKEHKGVLLQSKHSHGFSNAAFGDVVGAHSILTTMFFCVELSSCRGGR
jgi:hypothetical protein